MLASGSADPNCTVIHSLFEVFSSNLLFSREVVLEESQNVVFLKMTMTVSSFFPNYFSSLEENYSTAILALSLQESVPNRFNINLFLLLSSWRKHYLYS